VVEEQDLVLLDAEALGGDSVEARIRLLHALLMGVDELSQRSSKP